MLWIAINKERFGKRKAFGVRKRAAFLAQARQHKNEKPFINPLWQHFSTAPKLTEVSKFHPQNPTVSLQKDDSFSKLRSLASAHKVTLSHRFKSSSAIPGNATDFRAAGYMMNVGHFSETHESSGDLNRPRESRGPQPFGYFWFFSYKRKE